MEETLHLTALCKKVDFFSNRKTTKMQQAREMFKSEKYLDQNQTCQYYKKFIQLDSKKTGNCCEKLHVVICTHFFRFLRKPEMNNLEFLEKIVRLFPRYCMNSGVCSDYNIPIHLSVLSVPKYLYPIT